MRVLFLQDKAINESVALMELSAHLQATGHTTTLVLEDQERDLAAAIAAAEPQLILVAGSVLATTWVLRTCSWLRRRFAGIPVVVAGSLPTLWPALIDCDEIDMIIVGEAEVPVAALLDALGGRRALNNVAGLHVKQGGRTYRNPIGAPAAELDRLPFPDRGLYYDRYAFLGEFPWKKAIASRGCIYHCSFCYVPPLNAQTPEGTAPIRRKSPRRVVDEVVALAAGYPLRHLHFSDDLFVSDRSWIRDFTADYRERAGYSYSINTTASFITAEVAPLLANSGCRAVAIGVETHHESRRAELLNKRMPNSVIARAAELVRAHGMKLVTFNMIGFPGDTVADAVATMKFNAALGVDFARVTLSVPVPGTKLATAGPAVTADAQAGTPYSLPPTMAVPAQATGAPAVNNSRQERALTNVYYLFNWGVTFPALIPILDRLSRTVSPIVLAPANLLRLWKEKRLFGLPLWAGIKYFRRVGAPDRRSANFVSLVS